MARVLLPSDVEEWSEHKKLFLLLSYLRSVEALDRLIVTHTKQLTRENVVGQRLKALAGLKEFLATYCTSEEQKIFLGKTLPFIAKSAASLEQRIPECGISFLESQDAAALVLGRKLILSLLANAFLCTYPLPPEAKLGRNVVLAKRSNFDAFYNVFLTNNVDVCKTQAAKLKCILCYFQRAAMNKCNLSGVITLRRLVVERKELPTAADWSGSKFPLCPVAIDTENRIEDTAGLALQVDFANMEIGGTVLSKGRAQEEIRFCIYPELLISMLVMDAMNDNEAVIITGAERFADYKGYAGTLEFDGDFVDDAEKDVFDNILTSIVAIDAEFVRNDPALQYREAVIVRELNKAYVGFTCQQDRGDISTEQLALSVKRGSTVFFTDFPDFDNYSPELRPGALGNLDISTFTSSYGMPFKVNLPTTSLASDRSSDTIPLSPIMEETPSAASTAEGVAPYTVDDLALNLSASILNSSVGAATPKVEGTKSGGAVNDLVSSLSSSILQSSIQSAGTSAVNDLVSTLSSSILQSSIQSAGTSAIHSDAPKKVDGELESQADKLAKSIISDIISGSSKASDPSSPSSRQSAGQSTGGPQATTTTTIPFISEGLATFANQLASQIVSSAITTPPQRSHDVVVASSPSLSRPAIYIHVDRRGSGNVESPQSSRSSSITGQTITLHEFTDDLVEDSVREGIAIAQFAAAGYSGQVAERVVSAQTTPPAALRPTGNVLDGEVAEKVADSIVSKSLQDIFQEVQKANDETSATLLSPPPLLPQQVVKQPTSLGVQVLQQQTSLPNGDGESGQQLQFAPQLLSTPSSRVSYAWSTASTRDEDSRPVSPTDMERIGVGLASSTDEYANLFSNIILRDVFSEVTGSSATRSPKHVKMAEGCLPTESTKVSTMDTYLSSLDQAEPPSSRDDQPTGRSSDDPADAVEAYYSYWHKIRACLLRPLATGNWGCGAFGGDPQLKSMIQWIATSASGRPHMVYYTFSNKEVEKLPAVVKHVLSKRWTVGQLSQAVLSYCNKSADERKSIALFDALLKM